MPRMQKHDQEEWSPSGCPPEGPCGQNRVVAAAEAEVGAAAPRSSAARSRCFNSTCPLLQCRNSSDKEEFPQIFSVSRDWDSKNKGHVQFITILLKRRK